jgi:GTP cyclohydrolase II
VAATAEEAQGVSSDSRARTHDRVVFVPNHFGIRSVRLPTNNPRKMDGLERGGIEIVREPLQLPPTEQSRPYLETKAAKMDHVLESYHSVGTSDAERDSRQLDAE